MNKKLIYFYILILLLSSCEEKYIPHIENIEGQLVVEAQITNNPTKNFVHLTKTTSFYDKQTLAAVTGASVELVEINGRIIQGKTNGAGFFNFSSVPVPGENYKLRIIVQNDTYESEVVTMPPDPSILSFYTGHIERKEYLTDGYGVPLAYQVKEREIYIDAPITTELSNYRFNTKAVLEWSWQPESLIGPPPPPHFGWLSYYPKSDFNIAGPKKYSQTGKIEKHPLMALPYNAKELFLKPDSMMNGWIIIIDQYGTSKGSHEYHEKLNSQFAADGSLFDPIQTQIYGNITCTSDPSKIVFGYFDLNSYRQYRYFLYISNPNAAVIQRQIFNYPLIPEEGDKKSIPPDWWE